MLLLGCHGGFLRRLLDRPRLGDLGREGEGSAPDRAEMLTWSHQALEVHII